MCLSDSEYLVQALTSENWKNREERGGGRGLWVAFRSSNVPTKADADNRERFFFSFSGNLPRSFYPL